MAASCTAIIPRQGMAQAIAQALDTPQLRELVAGLEERRTSRRGRPGYGTRALLGACLVKSLYGLPTWAAVARLIGDHPASRTPSEGHRRSSRATGSQPSYTGTVT